MSRIKAEYKQEVGLVFWASIKNVVEDQLSKNTADKWRNSQYDFKISENSVSNLFD